MIEIKTRSLADSIGHIKKTFLECIRFAAHPPTVIQLVNQKNSIVLPEVERLLRQKDDSEEKMVPPKPLEQQAAEIGAEFFENGSIPKGEALTQAVVDAAKAKAEAGQEGGKKKRKSSKKRKSMKKKGGMKRKSMKVKA